MGRHMLQEQGAHMRQAPMVPNRWMRLRLLPHAAHDHVQVPRAAGSCVITCLYGAKATVAMGTRPGLRRERSGLSRTDLLRSEWSVTVATTLWFM